MTITFLNLPPPLSRARELATRIEILIEVIQSHNANNALLWSLVRHHILCEWNRTLTILLITINFHLIILAIFDVNRFVFFFFYSFAELNFVSFILCAIVSLDGHILAMFCSFYVFMVRSMRQTLDVWPGILFRFVLFVCHDARCIALLYNDSKSLLSIDLLGTNIHVSTTLPPPLSLSFHASLSYSSSIRWHFTIWSFFLLVPSEFRYNSVVVVVVVGPSFPQLVTFDFVFIYLLAWCCRWVTYWYDKPKGKNRHQNRRKRFLH